MTALASEESTIDALVARLHEGEKTWAAQNLVQRKALLMQMSTLVDESADEWVRIAGSIKQLPVGSPLFGEEWTSGPWATIAAISALNETIDRLAAGKSALDGFAFRQVPGNRVATQVMPHSIYDRLLLSGFSAEVWMQPGVTEVEARKTAGLGLLDPSATRGVTLVLGAGNIFSIAPLDTLYQLYAENRVVVLKLNPVTDPLMPVFQRVFKPFIELGAVEIITGGAEIGGALAQHPGVTAVHMTGSENTHDAIVWGPGAEGIAAKASGSPRLTKPISSELGGVAPTIVIPGKWSKRDLRFQAQHVATQRLHNSGSNCVASQVVVVSFDWAQKDEFLTELNKAIADAPARPAWYPGSCDRVEKARATHPGAAAETGGTAERTLLTLNASAADEPAFADEYFAPVLGVTELSGTGSDFLRHAVDFSNNTLRGTLGANIVVKPRDRKKIADFESSIADLRYGTIAINAWTAVGYLAAYATWGAYPGHPLDNVESGIGVVHNAALIAAPERTVVQGPFRPSPRSIATGEMSISPKPPWFVNNKTADVTGRRLTKFAAKPGIGRLLPIFASALRG
ncbi:MAG TPA: aldehyde dehydrogenase family protein [Marmoricola sp.]|nr:aldehyde dehydrogenase family protein [Marmoricola sp.]